MASTRAVSVPATEPVSVADAQDYLKVPRGQDNAMIGGLITAARAYAEAVTNRSLASKQYIMTMDMFPYFTENIVSNAYSINTYYARYSTLWNYSQMIRLRYPPVTDVSKIVFVAPDGDERTMLPGLDFFVDYSGETARVFPIVGAIWPTVLYVPNAVAIHFTAGYDPDPNAIITIGATDPTGSPPVATPLPTPPNKMASITLTIGVPETVRTAIMMTVSHWYFNREPVSAGAVGTVPMHVDALLASEMIFDFAATKG